LFRHVAVLLLREEQVVGKHPKGVGVGVNVDVVKHPKESVCAGDSVGVGVGAGIVLVLVLARAWVAMFVVIFVVCR
jgi:hypothetical protein